MGVQPPSDDIGEEPDVVEFGIAALDAELPEEFAFPVDAAELRRTHGDLAIPVDASGTEMALETALERCSTTTFDSRRELLNQLHPVFEDRREAVSNSVFARLRSLVPF